MSDPAAVDAALIAKLLADAPLMAIAVDGVYSDIGPQGARRFVIVNLQHSSIDRVENGIAFETPVYLVKVVTQGNTALEANAGAARIDALLENNGQGGSLGTIAGYGLMTTGRIEDGWRVRYAETDPDNQDLRWQHRGGIYEVVVQPTT